MKRTAALLIAAAAVAALLYGVTRVAGFDPWSKLAGVTRSGMASEVLVMRTPGGLLEVSRIHAVEQFDKKFVYSMLGARIGETVAHIRVPAVYRYHIELAPEWQVVRTSDEFKVVTPPVRPSLPVAVDLARMEKDEGGTWLLVPFNEDEDLAALEREITAKLAEKAGSPAYLRLQHEDARRTVAEFVRKWLVTQDQWRDARQPRIVVVLGE